MSKRSVLERKGKGSMGAFGVLVLALAACAPPAPVESPIVQPRNPDAGGPTDAASPSAASKSFLVRDSNERLSIVEAASAESAALRGTVVSALDASVPGKLGNASMIFARFDRAKKGEPTSLYVKLDAKTAPKDEEAKKEGLRATGVLPQTVAGDIATVLVTPEKLGALLSLPWVLGVETPGIVMPR
jgi:hypothetical protein